MLRLVGKGIPRFRISHLGSATDGNAAFISAPACPGIWRAGAYPQLNSAPSRSLLVRWRQWPIPGWPDIRSGGTTAAAADRP